MNRFGGVSICDRQKCEAREVKSFTSITLFMDFIVEFFFRISLFSLFSLSVKHFCANRLEA